MAGKMAANEINLDALVTRMAVRIDGVPYQLRDFEEFSFLAHQEQLDMFEELADNLQKVPKDKHASQRRADLLSEFTDIILLAPDPVRRKLSTRQRVNLINAFFLTVPASGNGKKPAAAERPRSMPPQVGRGRGTKSSRS